MLGFEVRGLGCGWASCWRVGVLWLETGADEGSGTGRLLGCTGMGSWACRGEPISRGPARTPCSPRGSGVAKGEDAVAVGSVGRGLLLMGAVSRAPRAPRGPDTTGLEPSVCAASFFFSALALSAFGRVS